MNSFVKIIAICVGILAVLAHCGLAAVFAVREAESAQKEFGKKRHCDAMQFVTVDVEQIHEKKKKCLAIFVYNQFSRPIEALACFQVNRQTLKHVLSSLYSHFMEYKRRSRTMASDRVQHDRVKNWAGRNNADEDCVRIIKYTEAAVNLSGQYQETVARRMQ